MTTYSPKVTVRFQLSNYGLEWLDVSERLINLATNKVYGRAAGAWNLTLPYMNTKYGERIDNVITTNDIITIAMDNGDGTGPAMVMLGLVSRVGEIWDHDKEGRPIRSIKVSGFDMGKLLLRHDCGWSITAKEGNVDNPMMLRMDRGLKFTGTPNEMVSAMLQTLFLQDVTEMAPYFEMLAQSDDDWKTYNFTVFYQTGSVWNAMVQCSNDRWNVLTTDTDPDPSRLKFSVVLENIPILDDGFLSRGPQDTISIDYSDIVRQDIAKCDDERVNYFWLQPCLTFEGVGTEAPIQLMLDGMVNYDLDSVARNGYNGEILPTSFIKLVDEGKREAGSEFVYWATKRSLALWNRLKNNHNLWSGSFGLHLSPRIRPGKALFDLRTNREYLVEQVDHQCSFGAEPSYITTLHVTRGQSRA